VPDRLDAEPPAGLTLLTLVVLFVTLNPVDKLWLTMFFVWTALMISIVLNIVPSYLKLKICNFYVYQEWKNKNFIQSANFLFIY